MGWQAMFNEPIPCRRASRWQRYAKPLSTSPNCPWQNTMPMSGNPWHVFGHFCCWHFPEEPIWSDNICSQGWKTFLRNYADGIAAMDNPKKV
jgi:hypothetical protein